MTKYDKQLGLPTIQERRVNADVKRIKKKKKGNWKLLCVPSMFLGRIRRCYVLRYPTEHARDQAYRALNRKTYYGYSDGVYEKVK
jgi:hypothetical protein